jgi:hypothetical protein
MMRTAFSVWGFFAMLLFPAGCVEDTATSLVSHELARLPDFFDMSLLPDPVAASFSVTRLGTPDARVALPGPSDYRFIILLEFDTPADQLAPGAGFVPIETSPNFDFAEVASWFPQTVRDRLATECSYTLAEGDNRPAWSLYWVSQAYWCDRYLFVEAFTS